MNEREQQIWDRIREFVIDEPTASLPYSARLAREQKWTPEFTQRVVLEYRRFAFLAVVAGHPVSPSPMVDEAWHLHLTYTLNYWEHFCPDALGAPLHHHPTQGGTVERTKFDDWYQRTLESYRRFFGTAAPGDIWPAQPTKPKASVPVEPISSPTHWMVPRPQVQFRPVWAGIGLVALVAVGCAQAAYPSNPFDMRGPEFLGFYALLTAVAFSLAWWVRQTNRLPKVLDPMSSQNMALAETAYLNGGPMLSVNAVVAKLVNQGVLEVLPRTKTVQRTALAYTPADAYEESILRGVGHRSVAIPDLRRSMEGALNHIDSELQRRGLHVPDRHWPSVMVVPFAIAMIAPLIGIMKIVIGVQRERPVGFLIIGCAVSILVAAILFLRMPKRSIAGEEALSSLRIATRPGRYSSPDVLPWAVALYGLSALDGTPMQPLQKSLQPAAGASSCSSGCGTAGSSDSGGSGCSGGGGCGGGCGGCGG